MIFSNQTRNEDKSEKVDYDINFTIEPSITNFFWNVPLDALMCPLQIINITESLSFTLRGGNALFIYQLLNVETYQLYYSY